MSAFPKPTHNHEPCMRAALAEAEALARRRKLRFTPIRKRVLEIILESHRAIGAYDILRKIGGTAPPTVYRALDFLLREGFVHRIDTLNAYAPCFAPTHRHATHFLLCTRCGRAAEIEHGSLDDALAEAAEKAGFAIARETVEIAGLCAACAENSARPSPPTTP